MSGRRARAAAVSVAVPVRRRLPDTRESVTRKLTIHASVDDRIEVVECYATLGFYADGRPGELFLKIGRQGSAVSGLADSWAIAVSLCLQYGVPVADIVRKFRHLRFEPSGATGDKEQRVAASIVDYVVGWIDRVVAKRQRGGAR